MHKVVKFAVLVLLFAEPLLASTKEDPFLWLEQIHGQKALDWVDQESKRSLKSLVGDQRFETIYQEALADLAKNDRLQDIEIIGDKVYNLLRNQQHAQGLWRRKSLKEFVAGKGQWETVLDVDALDSGTRHPWVFKGVDCYKPTNDRCLLVLSSGGSDAAVRREFDLAKKAFVENGFVIPNSKATTAWLDHNTLLVAATTGERDATDSGYPRTVKVWRRGTDFTEAKPIFSVNSRHVAAGLKSVYDGASTYTFLVDRRTFFEQTLYSVTKDQAALALPLPKVFDFSTVWDGKVVGVLKEDWKQGTRHHIQGALLTFDLNALLLGTLPAAEVLFAPEAQQTVKEIQQKGQDLYISVMDDVVDTLLRISSKGSHVHPQLVELPANGVINIRATGSDAIIVSYENLLVPPSYYLIGRAGVVKKFAVQEPRFDASRFTIKQHFASSKDGTKVPYFVVHPKGLVMDGSAPALMTAYGGFSINVTPEYMGGMWGGEYFKVMLEQGGSFVLANLRGGGEYGPAWHQKGQLNNRPRVYEDFHAVAEDLIARAYTSAAHLGIRGGSNGGLLVGVAYTQRPELYKAVICAVPLLDMRRYHRLLAGASWLGEYGDPDIPQNWSVLKTYSPYHNLHAGKQYPEVLFITSTNDDRVHPVHARKMAAKMQAQGHEFLYLESREGGHSGTANLIQKARLDALQSVYLLQQLE